MNGEFGTKEDGTKGDGTEENPHLIEDLWDFLEMNTAREHNNYKLVKDIDMNDYEDYKFELTRNLADSCPQYLNFDGGNHSIRNIIMKDVSRIIFKGFDSNFKNLKIENLCYINVTNTGEKMIYNGHGTNGGQISNIHIGCFFFDSYFNNFGIFDTKTSTDCTYNIRGKFKGSIYLCNIMGTGGFKRYHINFDCFNNTDVPASIFQSYNDNVPFDNCYFTGKIRIYRYSGSSMTLFAYATFKNSYINTEIIVPTQVVSIPLTYFSVQSYSFCNSDKIHHEDEEEPTGISFGSLSNFAFLDDEQCKDAEFLLSQGFPVVKSDT